LVSVRICELTSLDLPDFIGTSVLHSSQATGLYGEAVPDD